MTHNDAVHVDVPDALTREAEGYGVAGEVWLADLPGMVQRLRSQWGFELGKPFSGAHVSYTVSVTLAGDVRAVCKIPMTDVVLATAAGAVRRAEPTALKLWDGNGAVRLLEFDPPTGAMLLEQCLPGTALGDCDDHYARSKWGRSCCGSFAECLNPRWSSHGWRMWGHR